MAVDSFKDLIIWQRAMDLIPIIYQVITQLPATERFALSDQMRRAVISIPSNIAEGSKRGSRADFRQFCRTAAGSAAELETQLLAVERLYSGITVNEALNHLTEIQKMITSLTRRLSMPLSTTN